MSSASASGPKKELLIVKSANGWMFNTTCMFCGAISPFCVHSLEASIKADDHETKQPAVAAAVSAPSQAASAPKAAPERKQIWVRITGHETKRSISDLHEWCVDLNGPHGFHLRTLVDLQVREHWGWKFHTIEGMTVTPHGEGERQIVPLPSPYVTFKEIGISPGATIDIVVSQRLSCGCQSACKGHKAKRGSSAGCDTDSE